METNAAIIDIDLSTTKNSETLSSRLLYALARMKITQSALARLIGVKPQIIQYLCTGNANKSKFAYEIATALGVNPNWLIAGKGPVYDLSTTNYTPSNQPKVPLLNWNNISNWLNNTAQLPQEIEFVSVINEPTLTSYALRMIDTSMIPRFEIGTVLIVDASLKPSNGDFVIAQVSHQQQSIIRQLTFKADKYFLSPINTTMYKKIELSKEDKILGVVKQIYFDFAR